MTRQYLNHNMPELERLVVDAKSKPNLQVLKAVRDELKVRSTRKAEELLAEVEVAIETAQTEPSLRTTRKGQLELPVSGPEARPAARVVVAVPPAPPVAPAPDRPKPRVALPMLSAADAAKVLGVSLLAGWEAVETARARLVSAALFAAGEGAQADVEAARRANAAYASLAAGRRY